MTKMRILLNTEKDLLKFLEKTSDYKADVNIRAGGYFIDAKSLLGVMGIGYGKQVILEANTDDAEDVRRTFQEYLV